MENEIDLVEVFRVVMKRKWLLILCAILCAGIAYGYTQEMITPLYTSKTTLMVNGSKGNIGDIASSFDLSSINVSQKIVVTYSEIVKSRKVLEQVISRLELGYTYNQLLSMVNSTPLNETEILNITVTNTNPELAATLANTIADVFIKEVIRILKVDNVEIIDEAIPLYQSINVNLRKNVILGALVGIVLGAGIVFIFFMLDHTVKTEEDVKKYLKIPVLGHVIDYSNIKEN